MNGTAPSPTPTMSPADVAAHRAASYVRPVTPGDSDPDPDELLRRARGGWGICGCGKPDSPHTCGAVSPTVQAALARATTGVAYLLRDRRTTKTNRRNLAGSAA